MIGRLVGAVRQYLLKNEPPRWVLGWLGVRATEAGVDVTPDAAASLTAVWAAVRVLADSVASLPLVLYHADGSRRRASEYYLYALLHDRPNERQTAFEWRETTMVHLLLWGNAYSLVERDGRGRVVGLWPVHPRDVTVYATDDVRGRRAYRIGGDGGTLLPQEDVLHIPGLGFDGFVGRSPVSMARESLGIAIAAERYGGRFFKNDARPGVVLKYPGTLSPEAIRRLRDSWTALHGGENARGVAVLEGGMDLAQVGLPPGDAQFLETRKFGVEEVARLFRVPPHMLAALDRATFSNIEQQSLEFVMHSLRPWLVRIEQAIMQRVLTESERRAYYVEFLVEGLLRGAIEERYRAYAVARQWGWMTTNEIRQRENLPPVPNGDAFLVPLNMMMVAGERTEAPERRGPCDAPCGCGHRHHEARADIEDDRLAALRRQAEVRRKLRAALRPRFAAAARRVLQVEAGEVERALDALEEGGIEAFVEALRAIYDGPVRRELVEAFGAAVRAMAEVVVPAVLDELPQAPSSLDELEVFLGKYVDALAARWIGSSKGQLLEAVKSAERPADAVRQRLGEWKETRPEKVAMAESVQSESAIAVQVMAAAGVASLVWVAVGDTCPYCRSLHGVRVARGTPFLAPGEWQPPGADKPLKTRVHIGHPPAHLGCDCVVVPA